MITMYKRLQNSDSKNRLHCLQPSHTFIRRIRLQNSNSIILSKTMAPHVRLVLTLSIHRQVPLKQLGPAQTHPHHQAQILHA